MGAPQTPMQSNLQDGGGRRRDYGPRGCVGFAVLPAAFGVLLFVLRGGRRG